MENTTAVTESVPALEGTEVTSAVETGPGPAERTSPNGGGGGDGDEASSAWSLTEEQQVENLAKNWTTFLLWTDVDNEFSERSLRLIFRLDWGPWFAAVVAKLRVDPCLESCDELQIGYRLTANLVSGFRMTSLDVAILMGDLKMVQKILETSSDLYTLLQGSTVDEGRVKERFKRSISPYILRKNILYAPLHLAVASRDTHIVDALLEKGANVNEKNWLSQMPLDYACKIGSVDMLLRLLEKDKYGKDPLHIALRNGDIDFMEKLPSQNVNVQDCFGMTPLHYLATYPYHTLGALTSIVEYLDRDNELDVKVLEEGGRSPFYMAVLYCNTQFVLALLDSFRDQIRLNEVCEESFGPPIQIACERRHSCRDIESALMECDPVKSFMETLYRDRQVYVDAANAILVGAALIASVTFASWLQPPLNYTSYSGEGFSSSSTSELNYADVEHNIPLRVFWVFNALSFYFAIATVVFGARSVLPRSHLFIKKTVEKLRINLLVTSVLLACSVLFVIIAFAIAGTIVLTPLLKYQWYMIVPTLIGGMVCIVSLVFLVKSMVENSSNTHRYIEPIVDL